MRAAIIGLFLIFAIILGSTHASAVTHAQGGNAAAVVAMLDSDHHAIDVSDDQTPDGKGDVAAHHHCSVNLPSFAAGICHAIALDRSKPMPALVYTLASITSAPPIEPPST